MLNTEIKYKTSTDYNKLFNLLKEGNLIIGFISIELNDCIHTEYSKLVEMTYKKDCGRFDIGVVFYESDFNEIGFVKLCLKYNLRYIDL